MQEPKSLSEVASIKLGAAFKSAVKDVGSTGSCYLVQPKDISLEGNISFESLPRVIPESNPTGHYLTAGDIILRLRGPVFSAGIVDRDLKLPIIATNQSAIIRCERSLVLPYYLHWYLNSNLGQHSFSVVSEGTNISKINAKIVANIMLSLPTLEKQQQIAQIHQNWLAQKRAHRRLIENGNIYFDELCTRLQNGK